MPEFLESPEIFADFLRAFEDTSLAKERWTHGAHIAGGTVYLRRYGTSALSQVRTAIQRFNASKGGPPTAYHETITVFWLAVLDQAMQGHAFASDFDAAIFTARQFGEARSLHTDYYTYDVMTSDAARTRWVAPDARPLAVPFRLRE